MRDCVWCAEAFLEMVSNGGCTVFSILLEHILKIAAELGGGLVGRMFA